MYIVVVVAQALRIIATPNDRYSQKTYNDYYRNEDY